MAAPVNQAYHCKVELRGETSRGKARWLEEGPHGLGWKAVRAGHWTTEDRRPSVEALPTADTINKTAVSFLIRKTFLLYRRLSQDLQCLIHESVWHIVCIHSFIYFTKILDACYVPGTRLDTGDTGEQIAMVLILMGLTYH